MHRAPPEPTLARSIVHSPVPRPLHLRPSSHIPSRSRGGCLGGFARGGRRPVRARNGIVGLRFRQTVGGLSLYGHYAKAAFTRHGELVYLIENLAGSLPARLRAPAYRRIRRCDARWVAVPRTVHRPRDGPARAERRDLRAYGVLPCRAARHAGGLSGC